MRYGIFSFTFDGKYIDEQILLFDRYLLNEFDFYVINDSSFKWGEHNDYKDQPQKGKKLPSLAPPWIKKAKSCLKWCNPIFME